MQAREKRLVNYMNELTGVAEDEESIIYKLRKEMGDQLTPEEMKKIEENPVKKSRVQGLANLAERLRPWAEKFWGFFVKPGPYEVIFFERASKMYMRAAGFYWVQITGHIKATMGIE